MGFKKIKMLKINNLFSLSILVFLFLILNNNYACALEAVINELPGPKSFGKVAVKPDTNSSFVEPAVKTVLYDDAIIATGRDELSKTELIVKDGRDKFLIRIGNKTFLKLNSVDKTVNLFLDNGKLLIQNRDNLMINIQLGNFFITSEKGTYYVTLGQSKDEYDKLNLEISVLSGVVMFFQQNTLEEDKLLILPGEKAKFTLGFNDKLPLNPPDIKVFSELKQSKIIDKQLIDSIQYNVQQKGADGFFVQDQSITDTEIEFDRQLTDFNSKKLKTGLSDIEKNKKLQNSAKLHSLNKQYKKEYKEQIIKDKLNSLPKRVNKGGSYETHLQQLDTTKPRKVKIRESYQEHKENLEN